MTIRLKTLFILLVGMLILWVLYIERQILTPFILAGIFAYILNPFVDLLSNKLKIPRTLSVILIYVFLITSVVSGGYALGKRVVEESSQLDKFVNNLVISARYEANYLPEWVKPTVFDTLSSLDKSKLFVITPSLVSIFPEALSRIISFVIFLFSAFFFLKEGKNITDRLLNQIPSPYKIEVEILLLRINAVLGGYLRGQVFMILLMSSIFYVILSLFNVKFALVIAIFSGIAEIVPFIGPIVATTLAGLTSYTAGATGFGFNPFQTALGVVISYIVARQIQDYFVIPYIMGKITKLHPLVILFAVLAGGHTFGLLGLILAVPLAATIKILLDFSFDKVNTTSKKSH